jgi:hypothetical protein
VEIAQGEARAVADRDTNVLLRVASLEPWTTFERWNTLPDGKGAARSS